MRFLLKSGSSLAVALFGFPIGTAYARSDPTRLNPKLIQIFHDVDWRYFTCDAAHDGILNQTGPTDTNGARFRTHCACVQHYARIRRNIFKTNSRLTAASLA